MSLIRLKQPRLRMSGAAKGNIRTQFGALCYRVRGKKVQILLITSRRSRRWIIPKGWPMDRQTPAQAALTEAQEEAGVDGKAFNICLGLFTYTKIIDGDADDLPCAVSVFPVRTKKLLPDYPEVDERRRKWFSQSKAASKVREPELRKIIENFDHTLLKT